MTIERSVLIIPELNGVGFRIDLRVIKNGRLHDYGTVNKLAPEHPAALDRSLRLNAADLAKIKNRAYEKSVELARAIDAKVFEVDHSSGDELQLWPKP